MPVSKAQVQAAAAAAGGAPAIAMRALAAPPQPALRKPLGTLSAEAAAARALPTKPPPPAGSKPAVAPAAAEPPAAAELLPARVEPTPRAGSQPSRLFFFTTPPEAPGAEEAPPVPASDEPLPWTIAGADAPATAVPQHRRPARQRKSSTPWYISGKFSWEEA